MADAQTCDVRAISSARVLKLCMTIDTEKYMTFVKAVFFVEAQ